MLILTRRIGEKIVIGDNVLITVMAAKGSQIRIGIDAPRDITVHRNEIYQRILKERGEVNSAWNGGDAMNTWLKLKTKPFPDIEDAVSFHRANLKGII